MPLRIYRPRQQAITDGPPVAAGTNPMIVAKAVARWCNGLPEVRHAHAWRAPFRGYYHDTRRPTEPGLAVRVYLDWAGVGWHWNRPSIPAVSYIHLHPAPVAFVHRDPPQDRAPPRRDEPKAAIERWVAGARATLEGWGS